MNSKATTDALQSSGRGRLALSAGFGLSISSASPFLGSRMDWCAYNP